MSDYIDRQAAIDALNGEIIVTGKANAEAVRGYINLVEDRIKRLPSAERWIPYATSIWNYCPYCGAKMEAAPAIIEAEEGEENEGPY